MSSCQYFKKQDKVEPHLVAKAFDRNLYDKDLKNIIPKGASYQDSITIIRGYINNWLRQQVVLKKAEDNLTSNFLVAAPVIFEDDLFKMLGAMNNLLPLMVQ